jgi:hypothetical protein
MFWPFLTVSAVDTGLVKLGAVSVLAAILSTSLKAALALIVVLAGLLLWRGRKEDQSTASSTRPVRNPPKHKVNLTELFRS